jgi:signal transduction histidine kinase
MHDGLGGQLVSVLSLAEADRSADPRVAAGVRAAIDDMRLVIDSLDPGLRSLAGALGAARARFEPAFLNNGVAFEWQAGDLPPTPWLGPQDYLNVLRIVQEALANVIRHAEATRAVVRSGVARAADGRLGIEISVLDDGRGIASGTSPRLGSRGLGHMRERAARLSGWLRIEAADEAPHAGTRVVLWIPGSAPAPGLGV